MSRLRSRPCSDGSTSCASRSGTSASRVYVGCHVDDDVLQIEVRDHGVGGADPARGSGLIGLDDRIEALDGTLTVVSPIGVGTFLHIVLPAGTVEVKSL
jgi:signal transduction histidine kinase